VEKGRSRRYSKLAITHRYAIAFDASAYTAPANVVCRVKQNSAASIRNFKQTVGPWRWSFCPKCRCQWHARWSTFPPNSKFLPGMLTPRGNDGLALGKFLAASVLASTDREGYF